MHFVAGEAFEVGHRAHRAIEPRRRDLEPFVVDVLDRQHMRQLMADGGAVFDGDRAFFGRVGCGKVDIHAQDPALAPFHIDEFVAQASDCLGD